MKGVMRFGKKEKLSPHFVGPFPIVKRVGNMAYELSLLEEMSAIHNVLRKQIPDPDHVLKPQTIQVQDDLSYEEKLVEMLDRTMKKLHNEEISLVNVLWKNNKVEEQVSAAISQGLAEDSSPAHHL
ncbi:uncharacterized protein LOC133785118 [Humulus lupulus]|uniref:uncharacterized protein LOC133785118 n=1 Tax=Humulus lupulus TaxID=3486 RepID=UPI002B40D168|nr:uncharacterized protein LOC133785118 [Humulus lupulus]